MENSTFSMIYDNDPTIKDNISLGYRPTQSSFERTNRFLSKLFPAGSLLSTATDMTHFTLALLNDEGKEPYKLFNQTETLKLLKTQSYSIIPETEGNAHGFWEKEVNGKRIIEHGGNTGGFSSQLSLAPEEGLGYVLLTNVAGEATGIRGELETLLFGEASSTDDLPLKKSSNDKKVTGHYRPAKIVVSNMAKLGYITLDFDTIITENKEGGINVKTPREKESTAYVEVKPGVYQKVHKEANDTSQQYLYVKFNEKNQVLKISMMSDESLPVSSILDTKVFNFAAFAVSFIAFLGSFIYLLIKFIKQKFKKKADGWSQNYTILAAFSAVGLLVMITAIVMIVTFLSNPIMIISSMQPLFYINWLLPIFTVGMIVWLTTNWRKNEVKWLTIFLILIGLLTTVQFYNVHLFFYTNEEILKEKRRLKMKKKDMV